MSLRGKLLAVLCVIAVLGGCSKSGDDVASDKIDEVVDDFIGRMDVFLTSNATGEHLAAILDNLEQRHQPTDDMSTLTVDPLSWKGESNDNGGAVVVARISASVPEYDSGAYFGEAYEAGSKVRCFRFVISTNGPFDVDGIDCPIEPVPSPPSLTPDVELPGDANQRMETVFASTSASTLAEDVKAAFPENDLFTEATVDGDQFIATVGTVGGDDCLAAVRDSTGKVTFPPIPREWILPGEMGCHTTLVTNPPS